MTNLTPNDFETVIGLEVHLQFNTRSKIFCGCENAFGREPNSCVCPVCLGLPGTLPVLNKAALDYAIKTALALNCDINAFIKFDRKNYFYPDLPKGYQISQFDFPIGYNGKLTFLSDGKEKTLRIHRAHLEEDAGKLIHDTKQKCSLIDYNRTGTPLMEIVTEPDLRSPQEAYDYLTMLKLNLQYLDVSDCDMEKGSLRCDANISIRPKGQTSLGTKTELKNMNSFRAVKAALMFEQQRQVTMVLAGKKLLQETRLWDEDKQATFTMRTKEEAHDYRYFPEPDLAPFVVSNEKIDAVRKVLPENPYGAFLRLQREYGMSAYDAQILIQDKALTEFFEKCAALYNETKKICNWINTALLKELNERKISITKTQIDAERFTAVIRKVEDGAISNLSGKEILPELLTSSRTIDELVSEKGLAQVSDDAALEALIDGVLKQNAHVVEQIKNGNQGAVGFLIGAAMKASQGKANPKKAGDILKRRLNND
ncbi:MAG: Asp-tRNA(Asn)/Glu-tRNA(Gln) amidotransferase subunit GatB [Candidatus Omnitrophota bacterium]